MFFDSVWRIPPAVLVADGQEHMEELIFRPSWTRLATAMGRDALAIVLLSPTAPALCRGVVDIKRQDVAVLSRPFAGRSPSRPRRPLELQPQVGSKLVPRGVRLKKSTHEERHRGGGLRKQRAGRTRLGATCAEESDRNRDIGTACSEMRKWARTRERANSDRERTRAER